MISQIFDYNDDVQGEFIKVGIHKNILILKEILHHELFTAGYPHRYPVKKSLCGPCLMYEIEGYDKYEEDWVYQFLQMVLGN